MVRDVHAAIRTPEAAQHVAAVSKSRPAFSQMMAGVVLFTMALMIFYMYRVIDGLHQEQQEMRSQLQQLRSRNMPQAHSPHLLPTRSEFLEARHGEAAPRQTQAAPKASPGSETTRVTEEEVAPGNVAAFHHDEPEEDSEDDIGKKRRLMGFFTTGTSAGVGCFELTDAAGVGSNTYDVSTTACNSNICPDCFVTPATVSQNIVMKVSACSSAKWIRSLSRTGVWVYTFLNTHATHSLSVTDNSGGGAVTYNIPPGSYATAHCASTLGTSNRLYWESTQLPTLSVDSGITLTSGAFDASQSSGTFATSSGSNTLNGNTVISGTKTFATGTGAVTLNGATTVADSTAFTVGSAGSGGTSTFYGNVVVGATGTGQGASVTLNGDFAQNDVTGAAATFSTGTSTISINGHTTVAAAKNLHMASGAGTFQTGTGTATVNGNLVISGANTFTTGSGAVTLAGNTAVSGTKTLTVGTAGTAGATTLYGALTVGDTGAGGAAVTTLNGNVLQQDVTGASTSTFGTASGAVSLNGHVTVAANKNLHMTSNAGGTFQTGTGAATFNGNVAITGTNTFTTGSGAVTLNGATAVADNMPFSVGSPGLGGQTQLFGPTKVGGTDSGAATTLTVYADVTFTADQSGTAKSFTTSNGQITLNGDIVIAADKDLIMSNTGTGRFTTGTGAITLNGATTIASYTNAINCNVANTHGGSNFCVASR
eukprot:TRINITY_DN23944_c0_g1_i1.p1 TRINITY_DN23944_c0_g1~~TRINITY_DN23944_c0_g1_i1.p1  ORF type:complete len:709 (-),score=94.58 TRINITY_DN23944_c0_g1_i1:200-2326(-)